MADPKDIVNSLVDLTRRMTRQSPLTGDATAEQVDSSLDMLHFMLFNSNGDNTPTSGGSYVKVERVFEGLKEKKEGLASLEGIVTADAVLSGASAALGTLSDTEPLPGLVTNLLGALGIPPGMITSKKDALALVELLQNIDGVNSYVNNNVYNTFDPNAAPAAPATDEDPSVLPDEDPYVDPAVALSETQTKVINFFKEIGAIGADQEITSDNLEQVLNTAAGQLSPYGSETLASANSYFFEASRDENLLALQRQYNANPNGFTFTAEQIDANKAFFDEGVAADPKKVFSILANTEMLLDYENMTTPFTYGEYADVIQKTLNIYSEILNRNGFDIDRPIDLDAGTASLDDEGIDGLFGPRTNQSLQEFAQVMSFILTGQPGSKVYTPAMGQMWLDKKYHEQLRKFMSAEDAQALIEASYIVRENGAKHPIHPGTFIRALDAWANPPGPDTPENPNEPGYENYQQDSENGKYELYDYEMPQAKVRLFPLDAAQKDNVAWLGSAKLTSRVPNGLPLVNELMHIYSGFDLSHADPDFSPAFADGTLYTRNPEHGQAARLTEVFEKVLTSSPPPEWSVMEEYLLIAAGAIGDLPFGLIDDKEAFITAVRTALDKAEEQGGLDADGKIINTTLAARGFGDVLRHAYNTTDKDLANYRPPALYTPLTKAYPPGELPIAADDLDFTVTLAGVDEYDIYAAYMQQNENLKREGKPEQPYFFHDRIAGVDENGAFVVYQVPKKAIDAIIDQNIVSLDGDPHPNLQDALGVNSSEYADFVKAHELASRYNMPGLHVLALKAREDVKLQVPASGVWAISGDNMNHVREAQTAINDQLQKLDDDFRDERSAELFAAEQQRVYRLQQVKFDRIVRQSYIDLLAIDDPTPAEKEEQRELRNNLKKFEGRNQEERIDACIAAMNRHPSQYPDYNAALLDYLDEQATLDAMTILMTAYRDGQFKVDIQKAMDDYHASDEYIETRKKITTELGVEGAPWIDKANLEIDDVALASETYDINDIINAYNAQENEGPLFFKDAIGQTHVFYVAKSGIATVQPFDADEILLKQEEYNTLYDFRSGSASALTELMRKAEESQAAYDAALATHQNIYPAGEPPTVTDKALHAASWANIRALEEKYQKDREAIEIAAGQGKAASAGRLKSEFPQLAELCMLYNQTPDQIVRAARDSSVFSGGNGVRQPVGTAPSVDAGGLNIPAVSYHTSVSTGASYSGNREVTFHSMPWPIWQDEREAFKKYEGNLEKTNHGPVRQFVGDQTFLYVRADDKYLSRVQKQIEARETANADMQHNGKTLAQWREALEVHRNNIDNNIGNKQEEERFVEESKAAIEALEKQMNTYELNQIVSEYKKKTLDQARNHRSNIASPDLMIKIDVTDEVADIKVNGYDAAHAAERYPALTMIARQYNMGTPESLYTAFFDPTSGQHVPTFNANMEYSLARPSQRLSGRTDIHPVFDIEGEPASLMTFNQARKLNVRESRAYYNLTRSAVRADFKKDRLDRMDRQLVRMENRINERLAELEPGEMISQQDKEYIDEYKELAEKWVQGMEALPEFAARKTAKYYDRLAAIQGKREEYAQTATTMTGVTQSVRLDQRANRVGIDLKSGQ